MVQPSGAATLTIVANAPAPGPADIYNFAGSSHDGANVNDGSSYADGGANEAFTYVAGDRADQGQTFTTGSNPSGYQLTAVWARHVGYTNNTAATYWAMNSGVKFTVRVTDPKQAGTSGFSLHTETSTTTGSEGLAAGNSNNGEGAWFCFTLSSPVQLAPNKTYGFDLTQRHDRRFF